MSDLPRAQGSLQLSRAPVLAEDQLPNGPDSFLKNPAASRYGLDDATAAELLLRKSADDWGSSDKTRQRWLPASDRSLDYDQLANRLEPETIYNLADADYYRLGAAAYADRDPDSAPPVSAYDAAPGYADWSSAESQRRRQRLKQLAASAAAATAAADPPWRPRSSGRAAEIGELDLPSGRRAKQRARPAATEAPLRDSSRKSTPSKPQPPKPSKPQKPRPLVGLTGQSQAELAELMENYRQSRTAVVALALGLGLSLVAVLFLTCRIRQLRARFRRGGKALTSDEADYLINGMYL
uniref:Uncharacterized protein n=1 Tax=Macrostomum lignano TaxID=282301 RepID=A0A1I8IF78_9PLAT